MNRLADIRVNIMYSKTNEGEFKKHFDLVFLSEKANYSLNNEGDVIRERSIQESRFFVSEKSFDALIELLQKIRTAEESDLT
jgi:hypothetical protein